MCGIFASIGRADPEGLRRAARTLAHRGPDGFGDWWQDQHAVYLAHCRLSIIDLSPAGRQPMTNETGSIQLTFNGEIYNFQELRRELEALGHVFRSRTDTEVIVHGYEQWGEGVLGRLRGIFAFAIWDAKAERLFAARDHFGVKPLYYAIDGERLVLASETRALLPLLPAREPDPSGIVSFLRHGYLASTASIWKGVSRLPPATSMSYDARTGAVRLREYWNPRKIGIRDHGPESVDVLGRMLDDAVAEQLVSDVPVGVFLSGGIDSSLVASAAAVRSKHIDSFFIDFEDWEGSERADSLAVANHLGTRHHVEVIGHRGLALEDPETDGEVFDAFDEPIGDPAIVPSWRLARTIRQRVGVALSGDGGDELFAGYTRYDAVRPNVRRRAAWWMERVRRRFGLGREWPEGCADQAEYYRLLCAPTFRGSELERLFPGWSTAVRDVVSNDWPGTGNGGTTSSRDWQQLDLSTYLVDNNLARMDRASMAHGLEVRVPLLDVRIAEFALSMPASLLDPSGGGKKLLRGIATSRLPERVLSKRKQGFSFPLERLISVERMTKSIEQGVLAKHGVIGADAFDAWRRSPGAGSPVYKLWLMFVLEQWACRWWLHGDHGR